MVFEINIKKNSKIDNWFIQIMKELNDFYKIGWKYNIPKIILVPDRNTINKLQNKKTESWVVGWVSYDKIFILNPKNYEKESSHTYSDEKYYALLKHEVAHCFTNLIKKSGFIPTWLNEGLSIYLSGQNKFKSKPASYNNFLDFVNKGGKEVYLESGFAVEFLIKTYGSDKMLKLLNNLSNISSEDEFKFLFKSIYNFDLEYKNFKVLNSNHYFYK
jgi:hypothetical protein